MNVRFDAQGLVPGIVQDVSTGQVLMLGYLNREALDLTLETGLVHFWSRSRQTLWKKGETSGNTLTLIQAVADCDGDALLLQARPAGPTCHRGTESCFEGAPRSAFAELDALWSTISARVAARPAGSYTAALLDGGIDAVARKVLEEAGEVVLTAKNQAAGTEGPDRVAEETADLLYHLLVLLADRRIDPAAVTAVLADRAR